MPQNFKQTSMIHLFKNKFTEESCDNTTASFMCTIFAWRYILLPYIYNIDI